MHILIQRPVTKKDIFAIDVLCASMKQCQHPTVLTRRQFSDSNLYCLQYKAEFPYTSLIELDPKMTAKIPKEIFLILFTNQ